MKRVLSLALGAAWMFTAGVALAIAQPTPGQLADRMYDANQQWLANIETLEITLKMEAGGFEHETVTRYVKRVENGSAMLVLEEGSDADTEMFEGIYDGSIEDVIRIADSVTDDRMDGRNTYKVVITDQDFLNSLGEDEFDEEGMELEIEKGTLWIDRDELYVLKMLYEQKEDGSGMKVEMAMEDYNIYSGLPVAHRMTMKIEGMDQMMSDEDLAEARQAMREFEEQMESMPEAQRNMIREQMSGQMEQFEQMLESGMATSTIMEVVDVKVNR